MIADASQWVLSVGTFCVGVAALLTWTTSHKTRQNTELLKAEFKPNGGSSLKDALNRVEAKLHGVDARLVAVEEHITRPTGSVPVVKKAASKTTTKSTKSTPKKGPAR